MKNKFIIIVVLLLILLVSTDSTAYGYTSKNKSNPKAGYVYDLTFLVPEEWYTFMPRKLPFVPFRDVDNYYKIYEKPLDVSQYAGAGRKFNKNYKPYYPEKYLYATDYSYNRYLKETKRTGSKKENQFDYNSWLWDKIRSDFKRVHGMYNATITDEFGIKHKISWEDGGIVSIYEQYKLYTEYAIITDFTKTDYYKFLSNFRHNYNDVRVNSPFIEFAPPVDYDYFRNNIRVYLYDKDHRTKHNISYTDDMQRMQNTGGVLELKTQKLREDNVGFMGPDGKLYTAQGRLKYSIRELNDNSYKPKEIGWVNKIEQKISDHNDLLAKKDKLNVFLYYEIYDAFCRKYGYKYSTSSYTTTTPAEAKVKYTGNNYNLSEYNSFYNKYKDYIMGLKSPSSEFLREKAKLEEKNISIEILPEKQETHYYDYLDVNASEKQEESEVNNVYKQKMYKVKPQPYSVEKTVSFYKKLNKNDVRMILEHLQDRLNKGQIMTNTSSIDKEIMTDREIDEIYLLYENQPEKFRQFALELDKKYSQYYPQNLK